MSLIRNLPILISMVIERVTGKPYGDYLRDVLFAPNGLTSTVYCGTMPLIKRRARGYDGRPAGLVNADYISMNPPANVSPAPVGSKTLSSG